MENARPPTVFGASTVTAVPSAAASVENVATAPAPFASEPSDQFAPVDHVPPAAFDHVFVVVATAAGPAPTVTRREAVAPLVSTSKA